MFGKAQEGSHATTKKDEHSELPHVQLDFFFLKRIVDEKRATGITMVDWFWGNRGHWAIRQDCHSLHLGFPYLSSG